MPCSSCHDPSHGFTDTSHPSQDEFGPARRRAMPLTDLTDGRMHSDGEFAGVRELVESRILPFEALPRQRRQASPRDVGAGLDRYGSPDGPRPAFTRVAERIASDGLYAPALRAAFGDAEATSERIVAALVAYARSLRTGENRFDRFLAGDDGALSRPALRGMFLFTGKAGCAGCHLVPPPGRGPAELRDGLYHDTGIAWRAATIGSPRGPRGAARDGRTPPSAPAAASADRPAGPAQFKTPSLRDVARRGPYMHDGSLATLGHVVDWYDQGGAAHAGLDAAIRPLHLTSGEKDDLVAFLFALSSPDRAGLADPPAGFRRETTVRIVSADGSAVRGAEVRIEAAGDRFRGAGVPDAPIVRRTDGRGRVTFPFPPATHARLRVEGFGVAGGRLLPDVAGDADLLAVPADTMALRVLTDGYGFPRLLEAAPVPAQRVVEDSEPTRVAARRDGPTVVFRFARPISAREGLYLAPAPSGDPGNRRRVFRPLGGYGPAGSGEADLDPAGGSVTSIDLRRR